LNYLLKTMMTEIYKYVLATPESIKM